MLTTWYAPETSSDEARKPSSALNYMKVSGPVGAMGREAKLERYEETWRGRRPGEVYHLTKRAVKKEKEEVLARGDCGIKEGSAENLGKGNSIHEHEFGSSDQGYKGLAQSVFGLLGRGLARVQRDAPGDESFRL